MPRNPKASPQASAAGKALSQHSFQNRESHAIKAEHRIEALKQLAEKNGVTKALEMLAVLYAKAQDDLDAKLPTPKEYRPSDDLNGKPRPTAPAGIIGHKAHYAVQTKSEGQGISPTASTDDTAATDDTAGTARRHGHGGSQDALATITQGYPANPFRENLRLPEVLDRHEVTPAEAWDRLNEGLALLAEAEERKEDESDHEFWYRTVRRYQKSLELYNWYYRANREVDKSAQTIMVLLKHAKEMYIGTVGRGGRPVPPIMADAIMQAHENEASEMSDEDLAKAMEEKDE